MSNIQIYKKPELILLEENKKLRDYDIEQRNMQCIKLVNDLLGQIFRVPVILMGNIKDSDANAKCIPPFLNGPISPVLLVVPSGKITTLLPAFISSPAASIDSLDFALF